jgi:hypothetical protein
MGFYCVAVHGAPLNLESKAFVCRMAVFWVIELCGLVEIYRHFTGAFCLHHQGDSPRKEQFSFILAAVRASNLTFLSFVFQRVSRAYTANTMLPSLLTSNGTSALFRKNLLSISTQRLLAEINICINKPDTNYADVLEGQRYNTYNLLVVHITPCYGFLPNSRGRTWNARRAGCSGSFYEIRV